MVMTFTVLSVSLQSKDVFAENIPLTKINVAKTSTKLVAGGSYVIGAIFVPANATNKTVTCVSSKSAIASVTWRQNNTCKVVAKTAGKVTITVKSVATPTVSKVIAITVVAKTTVIRTPLIRINLVKKKSVTLPVSVEAVGGKAKLTYKSSKTSIVSVNSKAKITGKKLGGATVTITADSGKNLKVFVKVVKKAVKIKKVKATVAKTLKVGKTALIKVKLTKSTTTDNLVKFKSSKISGLTVNKAGKVTAKKKGKYTVTVKVGKKSTKVKIQVK
jgi:uncharacterized protein YjdB